MTTYQPTRAEPTRTDRAILQVCNGAAAVLQQDLHKGPLPAAAAMSAVGAYPTEPSAARNLTRPAARCCQFKAS